MFVTRSRFKKSEERAEYAEGRLLAQIQKYNRLVDEWNALARRFNALKASTQKQSSPFSAEDVQRLIQLCHPDKHGGKTLATEMTAKLIKMKESIE
jgi:hypothetical protein